MAKPVKPVLEGPPPPRGRTPVVGEIPLASKWTFSFRFWKQIDYFGLDQSNPKWFVSLLEKLRELSKEDIDGFLSDGPKKSNWRYHDISWTQKNIPIQRSDLNWLPKDYLDNPEEYPLVQFQVSQALGRVVGFWDENQVFNLILLDPLHNIQPCKRFHYRVDPCSPLPCVYTTLLEDIERVKKHDCIASDCPARVALSAVPNKTHAYSVSILRIENDIAEAVTNLLDADTSLSLQEIILAGVISIQDQKPKL